MGMKIVCIEGECYPGNGYSSVEVRPAGKAFPMVDIIRSPDPHVVIVANLEKDEDDESELTPDLCLLLSRMLRLAGMLARAWEEDLKEDSAALLERTKSIQEEANK